MDGEDELERFANSVLFTDVVKPEGWSGGGAGAAVAAIDDKTRGSQVAFYRLLCMGTQLSKASLSGARRDGFLVCFRQWDANLNAFNGYEPQ